VRKFSALASLDVGSIQAEKEAKVKEQIIGDRFKRNLVRWSSRIVKVFQAANRAINILAKWTQAKLYELIDKYKRETILPSDDKEKRIKELFAEAEELDEKEMTEEAEKKYIEIIGFDSKNLKAFKALGNLYLEVKNYEDAKQTFSHILNLIGDSEETGQAAEIYFNLGLVSRAMGREEEALENIKKALKIEPNNPRYLDIMLEIGIIIKDKIIALDTYERLVKANPENQKLIEFKEQIDEL